MAMQLLPMALSGAASLFGGAAQAAPMAAAGGGGGTPFDAVFNPAIAKALTPPMPAPGQRMPLPGQKPPTPEGPMRGVAEPAKLIPPIRNPLFTAGAENDLPGMDQQSNRSSKAPPAELIPPTRNPLFATGAEHDMKLAIAGANNPELSPYDLARRAGATTDTVRARPVFQGEPISALFSGENLSGSGAMPPVPPRNSLFDPGTTDAMRTPPDPVTTALKAAPPPPTSPPAAAAAPGGLFKGLLGPDVTKAIGGVQEALRGAPGNPLFQTGMGLLQSGYDGSNPYANIGKNLGGIQSFEQNAVKARADEEERAREAQLREMLALLGMQYGAGGSDGGGTPSYSSNQAQGAARVIR